MDAETLLLETEESMLKAVDFAKQEFSGVRTGKASPGLVENLDVHVSSYGSVMKLKGLAVISTPMVARLTDMRSTLPSVSLWAQYMVFSRRVEE